MKTVSFANSHSSQHRMCLKEKGGRDRLEHKDGGHGLSWMWLKLGVAPNGNINLQRTTSVSEETPSRKNYPQQLVSQAGSTSLRRSNTWAQVNHPPRASDEWSPVQRWQDCSPTFFIHKSWTRAGSFFFPLPWFISDPLIIFYNALGQNLLEDWEISHGFSLRYCLSDLESISLSCPGFCRLLGNMLTEISWELDFKNKCLWENTLQVWRGSVFAFTYFSSSLGKREHYRSNLFYKKAPLDGPNMWYGLEFCFIDYGLN